MSENFYRDLKSYNNFSDVFEKEKYSDLPDDWLIIATDVLGSTQAIQEGKYKEVNTIGASTIICILNATNHHSICYQFGGDGALIATPPQYKEKIEQALSYLKKLSEKQFNLSLRIAIWNKEDFSKKGYPFKVLKYQVSNNQSISMFGGKGVEISDFWLKEKSETKNLFTEQILEEENLNYTDGLECRWNPVTSERGQMVTGIIKNREDDKESPSVEKIFHLLDKFAQIESVKPVKAQSPPKFGSIQQFKKEWKVRNYKKPFIIKSFIFIFMVLKIKTLGLFLNLLKDKLNYIKELETQTDFQKFDGLYRFVMDLSSIEYEILKDLCQKLYNDKKIFYGLHTSDSALLTCMFFSLSDHFHFIDGENGGYALAAKQIKEQMKDSQT